MGNSCKQDTNKILEKNHVKNWGNSCKVRLTRSLRRIMSETWVILASKILTRFLRRIMSETWVILASKILTRSVWQDFWLDDKTHARNLGKSCKVSLASFLIRVMRLGRFMQGLVSFSCKTIYLQALAYIMQSFWSRPWQVFPIAMF